MSDYWNNAYEQFVEDLRLDYGNTLVPPLHQGVTDRMQWSACQKVTLRLMAEAVRCMFKPWSDIEQQESTSLVIRYDNARRTGLSSVLVHFQRMLLKHCHDDLHIRRYCDSINLIDQVPSSRNVSFRTRGSKDPMPSPTPYPHVVVCDEAFSAEGDKAVLLRPGGVCIVVSRALLDEVEPVSDQDQLTSRLVTPYRYIELAVLGDRSGHHCVCAVDKTDPDAHTLLATQHNR